MGPSVVQGRQSSCMHALTISVHSDKPAFTDTLFIILSGICMRVSVSHHLALQVPTTVAAVAKDVVVANSTDGIVMFAIL